VSDIEKTQKQFQFFFGKDTKIPKDIEKKKRFVSLSIS
jgi:hypothetical protein